MLLIPVKMPFVTQTIRWRFKFTFDSQRLVIIKNKTKQILGILSKTHTTHTFFQKKKEKHL